MRDRFHGQHSETHADAVSAYEAALHALLAHQPGAMASLQSALAISPGFIAARALVGFSFVLLAWEELRSDAIAAALQARQALASAAAPTTAEVALVEALDMATAGHWLRAAQRLEEALTRDPRNVVLLKIAHALSFMAGDAPGMLRATTLAVTAGGPGDAAFGYAMGCHAFALEELHRFGEAERSAADALAINGDDAWALHAAIHVDHMRGLLSRGITRLQASRAVWSRCNNFAFHMAWHLALFHVSVGDHQRALDLFDRDIRAQRTEDFRDLANAASLLWRLQNHGVSVGDRWDEIAAIARQRAGDTSLVFASLHLLLALLAQGDDGAVDRLLDAWRAKAATQQDDQARVARLVGVTLSEVLANRHGPDTDLAALAVRLSVLGGSHAQRDVFLQALAQMAQRQHRPEMARTILALRPPVGEQPSS